MKRKLFFLAALLTATVMNLHAWTASFDLTSNHPCINQSYVSYMADSKILVGISTDNESINNFADKDGTYFKSTDTASIQVIAFSGCYITGITYNFSDGDYSPSSGSNSYRPEVSTSGITINGATATFSGKEDIVNMVFGNIDDLIALVSITITYEEFDYLHFTSLKENCSVKLDQQGTPTTTPDIEYSTNNRKTWNNLTIGTAVNFDEVGATIWFRAGKNGNPGTNAIISSSSQDYYFFAFGENDSIAAGGNTMSLLDAKCKLTTMPNLGFYHLFQNAKPLVSAPELPATTLASYCYGAMFMGSGLVVAPQLPATTLAANCYSSMFHGCPNLEVAPDSLPADIMKASCYSNMFTNCSNLKEAPEMKVTALETYCFYQMFKGCPNLVVDTISGICIGAELEVQHTGSEPTSWNENMFTGCKGDYATKIKLGGHYCIKEYVPECKENIENKTICYGESIMWRGKDCNETKAYYDTLRYTGTQYDSVHFTLNLKVTAEAIENIENRTIRQGESFMWRGQTCNEAKAYCDTLRYDGTQCDSIHFTMNVQFEPEPVKVLPEGVVANITGNRWSVKEKNMVVAGNPTNGYEAYFAATDTAAADVEQLWKTNGAESAVKVSSFSSEPDIKWLARFNDKVVFQAEGKLYISDGAAITEIKAGGTSLNNPMGFTQINENKFIFTATVGEKNHLFISDGTTAESLYADDAAGFSCVFPGDFDSNDMNAPWCRVGRKVYFKATTTAAGEELWITNGTAAGTRMVKDIHAGENGSNLTKMVNVSNQYLVFKAFNDSTRRNFIWYSDGTEAGTKYFDAPSLVQSDNTPRNMAVMNGKVYTSMKDTAAGSELFAFDPAAGTGALVKDFNAGKGDSWPDVLGAYEGQMMTIANAGGCDLYAVTEAGVATKAGWNIAFPDGGYAQVNGSFISYGLYTKVGGDWGQYRIDSVNGMANAKFIYKGVTSGSSSDGIPCGYTMCSASNKLFFAVTSGDWAHKADNRGVFCYQYCKEGGVAENIEIDFGPAQITLTFDMQGYGEQVEPQTILSGEKFEKPNDPTAKGVDFDGWFWDAACDSAFDFNKAVKSTSDTTITIYAKWIRRDYLYLVGLNGNDTVRLNKYENAKNLGTLTATFEYSTDRKTWTSYDTWATSAEPENTYQGNPIALNQGDTIFFRAKGNDGKNATISMGPLSYYQFAFGADDSIAAGGNTMSLYDATCKQDTMTEYGFFDLFWNAKQLVAAPKVPAKKLAQNCYGHLFSDCSSLVSAPELPANKLEEGCYGLMFNGCTALTQAPELKATTLAQTCYAYMFQGCSSLQVDTCTGSCDGAELVVPDTATAPRDWNSKIFKGCHGDYANNIQLGGHYCIKEYIDTLDYLHFVGLNGEDTVRLNKVAYTAPDVADLTATFEYSKDRKTWTPYDTWASSAEPKLTYKGNPVALNQGDTVFFRAKGENGLNTTVGATSHAYFQFAFGADDSIAVGGNTMSLYDAKCEQDTMTAYGFYRLFQDAKQLVSAPKLPATQLAEACYLGIFQRCTALTQAPNLKVTTMAERCYMEMFSGCTSLAQAPELLATQLADYCYSSMFNGCTALSQAPELKATTLENKCYNSMFEGCTALTQAPELKATTLAERCYATMFYGCTALEVNTFSVSCDGAELVVPTISGTAPECWNINMFKGCHEYAITQLGGSYCISEWQGPRAVELKSVDSTKTYDGTPLVADSVIITGQMNRNNIQFTNFASQTKVGQQQNTFEYTLLVGSAADYAFDTVYGTLKVDFINSANDPIRVKIDKNEKTYDGEPLLASYSVEGGLAQSDSIALVMDTTELTDVDFITVKALDLRIVRDSVDVTKGYIVSQVQNGSLRVKAREVTLTSGSAAKLYDGTPLTNDQVEVSGDGFIEGQGATYSVTGSQTKVGYSPNTFSYTLNEGTKANNYAITMVEGILVITIDVAPQIIPMYDSWNIVLNRKQFEDTLATYAVIDSILPQHVTWYKVVGDVDELDIFTGKVVDDEKATPENGLFHTEDAVMDGQYYAVVKVPAAKEVMGISFFRSNVVTMDAANAPDRIKNGAKQGYDLLGRPVHNGYQGIIIYNNGEKVVK